MIKILIANDHAIVREGLKRILAEDSRLELVAEASSGHEAVSLTRSTKPDVAILDISMPERSGLDALADINPPYSPPCLLRHRQAPRLERFARSRVLTVQASTPPARSVAKRPSHSTWQRLVTEGW